MKRTIIGASLFLILVGEVTVGASNGLLTARGLIALSGLYITYFLLLDSLVARYRLDTVGIILLNFALYSVVITGLIHGEIANYILEPRNDGITTLIRIQCSFYPLFAFYILRNVTPQIKPALSVKKSALIFGLFILLITPAPGIGFDQALQTLHTAPLITVIYVVLALIAAWIARKRQTTKKYTGRMFLRWSYALVLLGLIPGLAFFITLAVVMIIVTIIFLQKPEFRTSSIC